MNRNPRNKHLKRINAPHHWMLDKLSGVWAPRPSAGPHKLRECLPIIIMLRNRLKYALTAREVKMIVMGRHIRVDGKVRTDTKFPCGFQDIVTINRTGEHFRLLYDVKGRFYLHRIPVTDATWKLLKVRKKALGARGIPYVVTHDGRTIPYPNPEINVHDTLKYDFIKGKVLEIVHFRVGSVCILTGGKNIGRVGILKKVEKHPGSFDVVHITDAKEHTFCTRKSNIFILGSGSEPLITLPKTQGIKFSVTEDREMRLKRMQAPIPNQNQRKQLSKGTVLSQEARKVRSDTKAKKRLIKMLRQEEAKQRKSKPSAAKGKGKGKNKSKSKKGK